MREFFLTIMHSWGSDTPQEVFWALNDMIKWLKTKGFNSEIGYFEDPIEYSDHVRQNLTNSNNEKLIKEISDFFENKL